MRRYRDETEAHCDDRLCLDFEERPTRLAQELTPLAVMQATVTFRDLRWHTDSRSANLRCEAKPFVSRKRHRDIVNIDYQIERPLERNKIMK